MPASAGHPKNDLQIIIICNIESESAMKTKSGSGLPICGSNRRKEK